MTKNKLAIFDLDGTLFDTEEIHFLSYQKALQEVRIELDREYFSEKCSGRHYKAFLSVILETKGLADESQIEAVHDRKIELYAELIHTARENCFLFDVITAIKPEYYIACATTASKKNVMGILNAYKRTELFDLILTQEDVVKAKPDPEAFLRAASHFQIPISEAVIFEDSETGLSAARASGAKVIKIERW